MQLSSAWKAKFQVWTFTLQSHNYQLALAIRAHFVLSYTNVFYIFLYNNITGSIFSLQTPTCSSFLCSRGCQIIEFFIHFLFTWLSTEFSVLQEQDSMTFLDCVFMNCGCQKITASVARHNEQPYLHLPSGLWKLQVSSESVWEKERPSSVSDLPKIMNITWLRNKYHGL